MSQKLPQKDLILNTEIVRILTKVVEECNKIILAKKGSENFKLSEIPSLFSNSMFLDKTYAAEHIAPLVNGIAFLGTLSININQFNFKFTIDSSYSLLISYKKLLGSFDPLKEYFHIVTVRDISKNKYYLHAELMGSKERTFEALVAAKENLLLAKSSGNKNMAILMLHEVEKWQAIYVLSETIDYEFLAHQKLAYANEELSNFCKKHNTDQSFRDNYGFFISRMNVYYLFKKYNTTIKNDPSWVFIHLVVEDLKNELKVNFNTHLDKVKLDHTESDLLYRTNYLRRDGKLKCLSNKQHEIAKRHCEELNRLENYIKNLITHSAEIKIVLNGGSI